MKSCKFVIFWKLVDEANPKSAGTCEGHFGVMEKNMNNYKQAANILFEYLIK